MNIFVLDSDPAIAARMHCDKHVVKMILELAQLLSSAHHMLDENPLSDIYKLTHKNHPCAIWVRTTTANYIWAHNMFLELCREYTRRYDKVHLTETKMQHLCILPENIPAGSLTEHPQCMPDEYKCENPVQAYQQYYLGAKSDIAKWKHNNQPSWWIL